MNAHDPTSATDLGLDGSVETGGEVYSFPFFYFGYAYFYFYFPAGGT